MTALPRFIFSLTLIADWLALPDQGITWTHGTGLAARLPCATGATRFIRRKSFVYLGLAQLVAGTLELSSWAVHWGGTGLATGWLAVVSAGLALALWLVGTLARRRGLSDFYSEPCLMISLILTAGVFAMAVGSRVMSVAAYRLGVVALGLNAVATMLLARTLPPGWFDLSRASCTSSPRLTWSFSVSGTTTPGWPMCSASAR